MRVKVRLLGEFRKHLQGRVEPIVCEVSDASSVADVSRELGLDPGLEAVVGVNGQLGSMASSLSDGDEVVFVSPMSGGADRSERGDSTTTLRPTFPRAEPSPI